jgi:hypothetical protein
MLLRIFDDSTMQHYVSSEYKLKGTKILLSLELKSNVDSSAFTAVCPAACQMS